ncbi:uncharacterized protein LOC122655237 [Telopea speciosissima]|uniref:uncharacterized protein LOC122655237 n=1 Tax=Telopea speciosissima TaxID=54955 RepID=UPI001CC334AB|nr:uncharacterized protein LOC122655237 [Telopea speciosissima]
MGAMLAQHQEDGKIEHAIYYLSKKFVDYETRYTPLEKVCTALIWATRRLRHCMIAHQVFQISRMDLIKYIFKKFTLTGRLARLLLLSEFDIKHVTQKSIKGGAIIDHLSAHPTLETRPLENVFLDEDIVQLEPEEVDTIWKLLFDGAANYKGCGAGILLITPDGTHMPWAFNLDFECSTNMAEYEACAIGLEAAISIGLKRLEVYGDYSLVICQMQGKWKIKDEKLIACQEQVKILSRKFEEITFSYLPRDSNPFADALVTLASMVEMESKTEVHPFSIKLRHQLAYINHIHALTVDGRPW